MPCTFCIELKNKNIYIYFKKTEDNLKILTDKKQIIVPFDKNKSLLENLVLHVELYKKSKHENFTKEYLISNGFYNAMENDSFLFIGHSESLFGMDTKFEFLKTDWACIYKKN